MQTPPVKVMLMLNDACSLGRPTFSYVGSSVLFFPVDNSQIYRHIGVVDTISCIVEHNLSYAFWLWVYLSQRHRAQVNNRCSNILVSVYRKGWIGSWL
jgi:hypothetical protein